VDERQAELSHRSDFRSDIDWLAGGIENFDSVLLGVCPCPTRSTSLLTELLETSLQKTAREFASLTRVNICQLRNAIVGAAEPPTELAVDILQHHHIRVDVGLVIRVEVSGRELVQHGWALRDDGG
jgi:hypothetical protein